MEPVLVDPREGSGDLLPMLQRMGVPSRREELPFGDVQVIGRGPDERPVPIGLEIKAVGDLLHSLVDKRLVGFQLPGLLARYEIVWIVVEGILIRADDGSLRYATTDGPKRPWGGPWQYDAIVGQLLTIAIKRGVRLANVRNREGTAGFISALWRWWNGKEFEEHDSDVVLRTAMLEDPLADYTMGAGERDRALVAKTLVHGIGDEKAKAAAKHFRSVREMVNADEKAWEGIKGIGGKLAARFVEAVRRVEG